MPRKKEKSKLGKNKKALSILLIVVLLPLAIFAGNISWRLYKAYSTMHQSIDGQGVEFDISDLDEDKGVGDEIPSDKIEAYKFVDDKLYNAKRSSKNSKHINILLIGVDSQTVGGTGRSDSIMVAQYNKETKQAGIISIPRDTFVRIPGRDYDKINHSYAYGGAKLLKETLESYLDIYIDNYMQVDINSFGKVIDTLGGITVSVPSDMVHTNGKVLFTKGTHHMNGNQVLDYSRARNLKSGGGGDSGRIGRQQQVITIILNNIIKDFSMNKTINLLEDVSPYVRTDITPFVVMKNWSAFTSLNPNSMNRVTLSGEGFRYNKLYHMRIPVAEARESMINLTK